MKEIVPLLITGFFSLAAAIMSLVTTLIVNNQKRKWEVEDRDAKKAVENKAEQDKLIECLVDGMKWILYDKIKYLGLNYIKEGSVDFDDRRILHEMHKVYHGLKGNGDLDLIMNGVDELNLKKEG